MNKNDLIPSMDMPEEWLSEILRTGVVRPLEKGQIFSDTKFTDTFYYLYSGVARSYYLTDGAEVTLQIFREGDFMEPAAYSSPGLPSGIFEALDQIVVVELRREQVAAYMPDKINTAQFFTILAERRVAYLMRMHQLLSFKGAQERYTYFLDWFPQLEGQVQLKYIASLLQITQATLSRVRGKRG